MTPSSLSLLFTALLASALGCGKEQKKETPVAHVARRQVSIEVTPDGYQPASIPATASEDLELVFTRSEDFECGRFIEVPGIPGQTELPLHQPVALPLHVPASGEVIFTCGMHMMHGIVVVAD